MPIEATCNHCGKVFKVSSKFAGRRAKCTACGQGFSIPALTASAPAADDLLAGLASAAQAEAAARSGTAAQWAPSSRQLARDKRTQLPLAARGVPVYPGPLFLDDDQDVTLRPPSEVARRALALWIVSLRAEGVAQHEIRQLAKDFNVLDAFSPAEQAFLAEPAPEPERRRLLVWRLESAWVLLWALGHVRELDWPSGMCDVQRLVEILVAGKGEPAFMQEALLRPVSDILDAQFFTMRIHWAIRQACWRKSQFPRT